MNFSMHELSNHPTIWQVVCIAQLRTRNLAIQKANSNADIGVYAVGVETHVFSAKKNHTNQRLDPSPLDWRKSRISKTFVCP